MIILNNVNKYFNHHKKNEIHVINNVNLELPSKGLVALLGPSGCGKTTLLNAIGGLDTVKKGNIYINNKKITKRTQRYVDKTRNLNIGYIFQNFYLLDNKTVFENVAIALKMQGIKDKNEIAKRVNYVLNSVGIFRYRFRPCSMLSGGERQRVGIARALVKNPNIILADEPTGNLDSNNTLEIMNIIKSISKDRLVLLVTHEREIAKFYADRILEIEDGKIINDYENKNQDNLDYRQENKFYLKDFKHITNFKNEDNEINIYNDNKNNIKLNIVVKNNNVYIQGSKNTKLEIVDDNSNIEFLNSHYQRIDKSIYEKNDFSFNGIIDNSQKIKYSSIFNPITLITNGFKKIFDYSFIKKLLLLGFFAAGFFTSYAVYNAFGINNIQDKYFISTNRNYYEVIMPKISVDNYLKYENFASVDYLMPKSCNVTFSTNFPYYYQTSLFSGTISGCLADSKMLTNNDLIYGRLPKTSTELVIDTMTISKLDSQLFKNVGISSDEDYIGLQLKLFDENTIYTIVGISNRNDPSIYVDNTEFINILANNLENINDIKITYLDYNLISNINLKSGRMPSNDYEVILPISYESNYKLNSKISNKINGTNLTVVGFYTNNDFDYMLVSNNTIKYHLIENSKNIIVKPNDENQVINDFNNEGVDIYKIYDKDLKTYTNQKKDTIKAGMSVCIVIIVISFIEIYLMIRSSFLSRIKEIGILRAIGVKKTDMYKMFFGEIFAITTISTIPGVLFMSYILKTLGTISYFNENYLVNFGTIMFTIVLLYIFNLCVGLLPVMWVVRQKPAAILARKDVD